ncbi:hypothetical protein MKEN_00787100 [Mycena kentingensis (nom. inval.)]|nr:hypothetical protein MKEN_00787100 [Mycena kentingensis (nom. inval.)]
MIYLLNSVDLGDLSAAAMAQEAETIDTHLPDLRQDPGCLCEAKCTCITFDVQLALQPKLPTLTHPPGTKGNIQSKNSHAGHQVEQTSEPAQDQHRRSSANHRKKMRSKAAKLVSTATSPESPTSTSSSTADAPRRVKRNPEKERLRRSAKAQRSGFVACDGDQLSHSHVSHASEHVVSNPILDGRCVDRSGYCAMNQKARPLPEQHRFASAAEAAAAGWEVIEADPEKPQFLADQKQRVFAVGVPGIKNPEYVAKCLRATEFMLEVEKITEWTARENDTHRGVKSINEGLFYGKGLRKIVQMRSSVAGLGIHMRTNKDIQDICTFASSALTTWFPNISAQANERLSKIEAVVGESYTRTFARSAFACVAFNFGPQSAAIFHRDWTDAAGEICTAWAGGKFNHKKRGHILFLELKIALEFPPGTLVLFPSAILTHANIPVAPHEQRVSIVQYTPGNLARFVDNGFRTEAQYLAEDEEGYHEMMERKRTRWAKGLALFSTIDELKLKYSAKVEDELPVSV